MKISQNSDDNKQKNTSEPIRAKASFLSKYKNSKEVIPMKKNQKDLNDLCFLAPCYAVSDGNCAVIINTILANRRMEEVAEYSPEDFSKLIHRSIKIVERCLKKMEDGGFIIRERRGKGLPDIYEIGDAIWAYNDMAEKELEKMTTGDLTEEEREQARNETLLLRKIFNYPGVSER